MLNSMPIHRVWILLLLLLCFASSSKWCPTSLAYVPILQSTTQHRLLKNGGCSFSSSSSLLFYHNHHHHHFDETTTYDENFFLHQVETTVHNVLSQYDDDVDILALPGPQREALGVARVLDRRLQNLRRNNDCPRCWMQRAHCICSQCPPVLTPTAFQNNNNNNNNDNNHAAAVSPINRIFLILHHKEIGMKVDTAKLILSSFPHQCRLVVAGIGSEYQASMKELEEAMMIPQKTLLDDEINNDNNCLVLFPADDAVTFSEIMATTTTTTTTTEVLPTDDDQERVETTSSSPSSSWDVIVLDGTWNQARKMYSRYIPAPNSTTTTTTTSRSSQEGGGGGKGPRRVQLSQEAVDSLQDGSTGSGHQLRRHSIAWKRVGTFEATRLFLQDVFMAAEDSSSSSSVSANTDDDDGENNNTNNNNEGVAICQTIKVYQNIANEAARRELGPPKVKN